MKNIKLSENIETRLRLSNELDLQKEIYLSVKTTEVRIAEVVEHLKVIKITLVIICCVFVILTILALRGN